uniref:Movement protein TGBp3 n=1 Tax=Plantago asiatica mosaic potexvirus TaxID=28354 RepID=A0A1V1FV53_P1AMV|nr:Triple gene block protein 3 [Plantago asiatica mosaic virus]
MHSHTGVGTSTEPNLSTTSAHPATSPKTPCLSPSYSSSLSQGSFYYYLAATVLLLTALAAASLTPRPSCVIIITGHSTVIQGNCQLHPHLILAAHPKGLSLEQFSKFQNILNHGSQHSSHR